MHESVIAAFDRQDYRAAAQLLKQWQAQQPNDPWLQLYIARLQESTGKGEAAIQSYRAVLKSVTIAKIITQARQGLQRLEAKAAEQRQAALAAAAIQPADQAMGVLVLAPVTGGDRAIAVQGLAQVMQLDPYVAQSHLPARGWRLYRTGPIGVLRFYQQELAQRQVPAFCQTVATINEIHVFRVVYVQCLAPTVTVVCQNDQDQLGALSFTWAEVSQTVAGLVPILEEVIDLGAWQKRLRKEKTQDYAHLLDLHLLSRNTMLRFCDRTYQFQDGVQFSPLANEFEPIRNPTIQINWQRLKTHFQAQLTCPAQTGFKVFGESALEFIDLLGGKFPTHIDLYRKIETQWDEAFQLYSGLAFLQQTASSNA